MNTRPTWLLAIVVAAIGSGVAKGPVSGTDKARKFDFVYQVTVAPAPGGTLRVWIPVATSDDNQDVILKNVSSPVPTETRRDSEYGNSVLYGEVESAGAPATLSLTYEVTRKEYSRGGVSDLMRYNRDSDPAPPDLARFLEPDRMVPINTRFQTMAADITRGKNGDVAKAYAIYDYVFHTLRYDKSGTGWGRGDAMWACDSKHGNCTDFHSLFMALMRAEKIPARFEIGFPLPANSSQGDIPGYHCWSEFYLSGLGWAPVDISEAWKDPARHDFFFGSLDTNRVQFTIGRDLVLNPPQGGPPLNYFVYPYVELNGQPYDRVEKKFSFRDLPSGGAAAGR
ncbi:MAG TPA: transglutaminase domain-containing protein [Terriglobia bacterium]|nr:transglutaminase domain-containing protein [Terriglobia bacterium]